MNEPDVIPRSCSFGVRTNTHLEDVTGRRS